MAINDDDIDLNDTSTNMDDDLDMDDIRDDTTGLDDDNRLDDRDTV